MGQQRADEARTHLSSHPTSAAAARRFARGVLDRWQWPDDVSDTVLLCTDELVTNAILHAMSDVDVVLRRDDGVLRVEVHDGSRRPPLRRVHPVDADAGRGLRLVGELVDAWGVESTAAGKAVWFEVRTPIEAPTIGT